jgi:hypothetical protein
VLIFRRSNCIIAASGTVPLCKRPFSVLVKSPLLTSALKGRLESVTIPEAAIIKLDLLKLSMVMLEICTGT